MISLSEWDNRFKQQAGWTASIRSYLFKKAGVSQDTKILDIGCGTGVLLTELIKNIGVQPIGMDVDCKSVHFAYDKRNLKNVVCADAYQIPLAANSVDIVFFHFVLLWLTDPLQALIEVKRCLKPDGWLLCLAEPDHASRVDYPSPLDILGRQQTESLAQQGADIQAGRKLGYWIHLAGLQVIETGVIGSQWQPTTDQMEENMEWEWLINDGISLSNIDAQAMRKMDASSRLHGSRVLNVPTYYACARKNQS